LIVLAFRPRTVGARRDDAAPHRIISQISQLGYLGLLQDIACAALVADLEQDTACDHVDQVETQRLRRRRAGKVGDNRRW
jgi:hypothetical protein